MANYTPALDSTVGAATVGPASVRAATVRAATVGGTSRCASIARAIIPMPQLTCRPTRMTTA